MKINKFRCPSDDRFSSILPSKGGQLIKGRRISEARIKDPRSNEKDETSF